MANLAALNAAGNAGGGVDPRAVLPTDIASSYMGGAAAGRANMGDFGLGTLSGSAQRNSNSVASEFTRYMGEQKNMVANLLKNISTDEKKGILEGMGYSKKDLSKMSPQDMDKAISGSFRKSDSDPSDQWNDSGRVAATAPQRNAKIFGWSWRT